MALLDCKSSLLIVQCTSKGDSDMARPVDPDSGFRVKIHDNGGHRYASTQPAFTDPVTGRKKYRRLHWGVVDENNKFHPVNIPVRRSRPSGDG